MPKIRLSCLTIGLPSRDAVSVFAEAAARAADSPIGIRFASTILMVTIVIERAVRADRVRRPGPEQGRPAGGGG